MGEKGIQIVMITGSVRPDNYTSKAAALVVDEFRRSSHVSVKVIDPNQWKLPLPGAQKASSVTQELQSQVGKATGVVFATPEYHGSVSSIIKLFIENLGFPSVLAGKAVALIGVAAGAIGAVKALEHLRSICSHVGAIVLPGPVSVAHVHKVFDTDGRCLDEKTESRVRGVATSMTHYIQRHICPRVALERMVREVTE